VYGYDLDDRKIMFIQSGYGYATDVFKHEENVFVADSMNGIYHLRINDDYYYK
jgi:hypothetical protein